MNQASSEGKILIVCKKCGTILYRYAIGDKKDKNKFNGPPVPKKALSGFDGHTCPVCGEPLSMKPKSIKFFTLSMFNKLYSDNGYALLENTKSSVPDNISGKSNMNDSDKANVNDSY
ncbi:MAG: hypothetical protein RXQ93_00760 [Caldisphaera sp.]|uniref:hypothetical protein n=1 Tax=Caldisphaera sp. TaxID=2060322 RepID=UPI0039790CC6